MVKTRSLKTAKGQKIVGKVAKKVSDRRFLSPDQEVQLGEKKRTRGPCSFCGKKKGKNSGREKRRSNGNWAGHPDLRRKGVKKLSKNYRCLISK